jgi:formate dehydrogenase subunit gamma
MAATTPRPSEIRRFSAGERWLHLAVAVLMGVLIVTAAFLYVGPLSTLVGRRALLATVHFWSGVLLPVPLVLAALLSVAFRRDARRLNRFHTEDKVWLRAAMRGNLDAPSGKFNAGQKLNSALVLGAIVVMFVTGLMLHFFDLIPDNLRTGATFVHDLFALMVVILAAGHFWMAWNDPEARRGLRTGKVGRDWAERKHPLWTQESAVDSDVTGPS